MTRESAIKWKKEIEAFQNGKTIQCLYPSGWIDVPKPCFSNGEFRIKPEPTKRLPTIQEVEKWFLENKVFIHKKTNVFCRIERVDKSGWEEQVVYIYNEWFTLNTFCKEHTHYDGSELYITENE